MLVTFISQCEKNALKRSRRVLDSFANRIGSNVWQTVITNDGLNAVKKLLRKTASKNTAVACHLLHRNYTELLWIVGDRQQFNAQGLCPVHRSKTQKLNHQWENNWHQLPFIKVLVALAGLFHDWGKSSDCFQNKLTKKGPIADPLRHEWISCLLLQAFVLDESNEHHTDQQWLTRLAQGRIDVLQLQDQLKNIELQNSQTSSPFDSLPPIAQSVSWLILSHHRLPLLYDCDKIKKINKYHAQKNELLSQINQNWGYQNELSTAKKSCFHFKLGLPCQSNDWMKQARRWAQKGLDCLQLSEQIIDTKQHRLLLQHTRLALMLGDHCFSSQLGTTLLTKQDFERTLIANTYQNGEPKQTLEAHLLGVTATALQITQLLPRFEQELPQAQDLKKLTERNLDKQYSWQDSASKQIQQWRNSHENEHNNPQHFGFFAVNMASTGCGKTIANAKIMRMLSPNCNTLRYVLALGLRTLTLQTGDAYRERIGLDETELAVLIGSQAVQELHDQQNKEIKQQNESNSGSESEEILLDQEIIYDCLIPEDNFITVLKSKKDQHFLYAPVLVCTIDHIMGATETGRGGRYILPYLRLLSSDLVIDEVDDFTGDDLIAIGRLIHLAGLLGRKVMISSATIPPDIAEGYFYAYQQGWAIFSASRGLNSNVGCAWVDEFKATVDTIQPSNAKNNYAKAHQKFITNRIKKLSDLIPKRKGQIIRLDALKSPTNDNDEKLSIQEQYFEIIKTTALNLHQSHHIQHSSNNKKISFGVIRMANVTPCVNLALYLNQCELPEQVSIRVMPYHSRQILLMRHEQEKHLDKVLNRSNCDAPAFLDNDLIKQQIKGCQTDNLIYILVATPVEEVGRDHDFDWAIIEPSSYRSIIQLVGRVLRHRFNQYPKEPNIALLQYNLKGLTSQNNAVVFHYPGYETKANLLEKTEGLVTLLTTEQVAIINAIARIQRPKDPNPKQRLVDLEHHVIAKQLMSDEARINNLSGWLDQSWYLTFNAQFCTPFRKGTPEIILYVLPDENEKLKFCIKNDMGDLQDVGAIYNIKEDTACINNKRQWLPMHYCHLLNNIAEEQKLTIGKIVSRYGEISIPAPRIGIDIVKSYQYNDYYGLITT